MISFIIPAYNSADSVEVCLDSIVQNYCLPYDYEIIVVDDASTDNTYDVVNRYANNHTQCRIIRHSINKRQGGGRNTGLSVARGRLISFVDSDDEILPGINNAINIAIESQAEITFCSAIHKNESTLLSSVDLPVGFVVDGVSFCEKYWSTGSFWRPWGYIFDKSFLLNLNCQFVEFRRHEDRDWIISVLTKSRFVTNSPIPMYFYKRNAKSTCNLKDYDLVFDHIASGIRFIKFASTLQEGNFFLKHSVIEAGIDEIYKNIRIRNLTKYPCWDNLRFGRLIGPLIEDLKLFSSNYEDLSKLIYFYIYNPQLYQFVLVISYPLCFCSRKAIFLIRTILGKRRSTGL